MRESGIDEKGERETERKRDLAKIVESREVQELARASFVWKECVLDREREREKAREGERVKKRDLGKFLQLGLASCDLV
jgi:hypothetical protein